MADATARRLAALLGGERPAAPAPRLLTAAEVAGRFGFTVDWVRDHAAELGVLRVGDGPRPRLRFDPDRVTDAVDRRFGGGESPRDDPPAHGPVRRARRTGAEGRRPVLLPIREEESGAETTKAARRSGNSPGPAPRDRTSPRSEPNPEGSGSRVGGRPSSEASR